MLVDLIRVPDPRCIDDLLDEPLGLMYLAASVREAGHQVRITNLAGCTDANWQERLAEADVYGIQLYTPTVFLGIKIAEYLRTRFPRAKRLCGGAHPSALPDAPELAVFDAIVAGEGETAIVEIVNRWQQGAPVPRVWRSPLIKNLDSLPLPARDLVDMNLFHRKVDGARCFGILASRGCVYKCAFCDQSVFGHRVRFRSLDNLMQEINGIIAAYGIRHFEFFDDMFADNHKLVTAFRERMAGGGIIYRCNGRTDRADLDNYRVLYDSGCRVICYGIESGSQYMLDRMNKHNTVANARRAIDMAHEAGMLVNGYFIIGFPGETAETIEATMEFIRTTGIDQAQGYTFVPLPGCDVSRNPEKYGIISMSKDYSEYYLIFGTEGMGGRTISTKYLSAEQLEAQVRRFRQFLKERPTRGKVQDYYSRVLHYNIKP
ncbi:MAG: radical SAM protein [Kiritimatiellae bacterium]|nr:radical SAM protein [Kiritimatiellia bacterium]